MMYMKRRKPLMIEKAEVHGLRRLGYGNAQKPEDVIVDFEDD